MRVLIAIAILALAHSPSVLAKDGSRSVKLSKGTAKVRFSALQAESQPTARSRMPRVGIAPSPSASFGNFLVRKLDDLGKVAVVSSTKLSSGQMLASGFEQATRSELAGLVSSTCRQGKLDYILLLGSPQSSSKTDITAMIFFVGKMRFRTRQEARLYDCLTRQSVWVRGVSLETSQGVLGASIGGAGAGFMGGPEAEQAMAGLFAEQITADMGW